MKRLFLSYIIPVFCLLGFSCTDELSLKGYQDKVSKEGSMEISFIIDDPDVRSRVVDMTPGVAVYIDKVWVGIYDREKGIRVGGTKLDDEHQTTLDHRLTAAQVKIPNAIPIEWYDEASTLTWDGEKERELCVVCVANYDNPDDGLSIYTDKADEKSPNGQQKLWTALRDAKKWSDFIDIAIDCNSDGFTGGKPMLMGYLYQDTDQLMTFTKVDQFNPENTENEVRLFPAGTDDQGIDHDKLKYVKATVTGGKPTGLEMEDYLVKLRRLRSRINVKIETRDDDMTVTSLQYAVFNKPNSVFLAQRRTNRFEEGGYPVDNYKNASMSPNSADVHVNTQKVTDSSDDQEDTKEYKVTGYFSDINNNEVLWQTPTNLKDFAFDHFENKHWTVRGDKLNKDITLSDEEKKLSGEELKKVLNDKTYDIYHNREENKDNFTFSALADDATDWNNNASYFVLKVELLDKKTGKQAHVQYTIHEGFCNDYDGNEVIYSKGFDIDGIPNDLDEYLKCYKNKAKDFSCVRNTNYTYNIKINSFEDIEVQVGTGGHSNDQLGDIWQMKYWKPLVSDPKKSEVVGNRAKANDWKDDHTIDVPSSISFVNAKPEDIAFRLVGAYKNDDGEFVDVDFCYNFARGDLDNFANLWATPSVITEYIIDPQYEDPLSYLKPYTGNPELNLSPDEFTPTDLDKMMSQIMLKVGNTGELMTVYEYLYNLFNNKTSSILTGNEITGFQLAPYNLFEKLDNEESYVRGLYIFDREKALLTGSRIQHDGSWQEFTSTPDGSKTSGWFHDEDWLNHISSCKVYEINAVEQLPKSLKSTEYKTFYATEKKYDNKPMDYTAQTFPYSDFNNGKGIQLSSSPSIAFRLIGEDNDGNPYDLCYNLNPADYPDYNNSWPQVTGNTVFVSEGYLGSTVLPTALENDLKILTSVSGGVMKIKDFVSIYDNRQLAGGAMFGFQFEEYKHDHIIGDPTPHRRALYVLDKNTYPGHKPIEMDDQTDKAIYKLYAAEQYPPYTASIPLELPATSSIEYTHKAEYDIVDPILGTIKIPAISDVSSEYYYYQLSVESTSGTKTVDITGEPSIEQSGVYYYFDIPMYTYVGNTGASIYLKAIAKDATYKDSGSESVATFDKLKVPSWDFTTSTWENYFKNWGNYNSSSKYYEFKGTQEQTKERLTLYAGVNTSGSAQEMRLYTGQYLYFNNSGGDNLNLKTTIYKNCKITAVVGSQDGRSQTLTITGSAGKSNITSQTTFTDDISVSEGGSLKMQIHIGNKGTFYSIKLE